MNNFDNYIVNLENRDHEYFHPSGEVWQKYSVVDGALEGEYSEFHTNGNLMKNGIYEDGKKQGKWTCWHDNGKIWYVNSYLDDRLHGECSSYRGDGGIEYKGEYTNGLKCGEWEINHDNGNKDEHGSFKDGKKHGVWHRYHYLSGEKYYESEFVKGKEVGLKTEYYLTGELRRKFYVENFIKNGEYKEFDKITGKVCQEGFYKNDKISGEWKVYYSHNNICSIQNYTGGILNGDSTEFYETGEKRLESFYSFGKLTKDWIHFYKNGDIREKTTYKKNVIHGDYLSYHENGTKWQEMKYVNGKNEGEYSEFFTDGNLNIKGNYINGCRTGEWTFHFQSGDIQSISNYADNKRNGLTTNYHENSKIASVGKYISGKKEEKWEYTSWSDEVEIKNYRRGIQVGKWESFDIDGKLLFSGLLDSDGVELEKTAYHLHNQKVHIQEKKKRLRKTKESKLVKREEYNSTGIKTELLKIDLKTNISDHKSWFNHGVLKKEHKLKDNKYIGDYLEKFANDTIRGTGYMKDGEMNGKWTFNYHNGQTESEIICENGKLIDGKVWDDDGNKKESIRFSLLGREDV